MSRNVIEIISSEDDSIDYVSNPKPGSSIHTLSSSSDSEVESTSLASRKTYNGTKVAPNHEEDCSSPLSFLEEFPSPSKLDAFQSSSKYKPKTNLKRSSSGKSEKRETNILGTVALNKEEYSRNLTRTKTNAKRVDSDTEDEAQNLDNSISSIKSHDISDSNSDGSMSMSLPSPVTNVSI